MRSIPNIKPTKKQKPTLIDFVEDEERNIGIFQYTYVIMPEFIISPNDYEFKVLDKEKRTKRRQSELMKGQKGQKSSVIDLVDDNDDDLIQQDESDNDQTAFQEQVEELSQLIKKITKAYGIVGSSKEYGVVGSSKEYGVARSSKSAPPPSSSSSSSLSSSSSPSPSPFPSPSSSFSSSNSSFLYYEEMDRDLRTALRYIVHERHHHQKELLLNSEKDANWKDLEKRRKHANSRRSDKQERQNKTIDNLEVSETDSDNPNKRKIIIRDLKWRSATLHSFLRNYVNNAASNARRVRKQMYDTEYAPNENSAPVNAPKWAKISYKGSLKHLVEKYSANREEEDDDKSQEDDNKSQENDNKSQENDNKSQENDNKSQENDNKSQENDDATGGERNEDQEKEQDEEVDNRKKRKKRSVSLVSEEYDSSNSSKSVG
ncbi:uncharacterized protein OCT59_026207 [Rhizophagus irregularis]|uniref:uncharacterized protein n=1 Tax=Rhizophagus irregularis TaxID=588596 RepID=UPI0033222697|nr:hypothetical protein OCT59_026207 [Rhizophagus irregularis]